MGQAVHKAGTNFEDTLVWFYFLAMKWFIAGDVAHRAHWGAFDPPFFVYLNVD